MTIERRNKNAGSLAGVGVDAQDLRFCYWRIFIR